MSRLRTQALRKKLLRLENLVLARQPSSLLDPIRQDPAQILRLSGLVPDPWQEQLLRSEASRVLLLCSRQVGKSTAAAAVASKCSKPGRSSVPRGLKSRKALSSISRLRPIRLMKNQMAGKAAG